MLGARCSVLGALITLCFGLGTNLSAQNPECTTPDIPLAQMEQILANLSNNPIVAGSSPFRIPIWFVQIRDSGGSTNFPGYDIEQQIGELNQYFDGIFEFSVCGTNVINNSTYYDLDVNSEASALHAEVNASFQPVIDHCVKVFLVGGISDGSDHPAGYTHNRLQFNENGAVYFGNASANTLAHEMGHYFGLPHTFLDAATQYVNTPVTIGGTTYTCHTSGDGFCDTPAEVEYTYSVVNGVCIPNSMPPDPLGAAYTPDPTLLMSYSHDCRNRFSDEQIVRMLTLYNLVSNYDPLKNAPNECLMPKYGKIERNCVDVLDPNNSIPDFTPMANVPVEVRDVNNICLSQNNLTNTNGRFLTEPCAMTDPLRKVFPSKNHPDKLNGVSILDIFLIKAHVVSAPAFENPFQIIAADVNNNGSVTTFDAVTIQKVLLDPANQNFPAGNWRYVPKLFTESQAFLNQFWDDTQPQPGIQPNPFDAVFIEPFQLHECHYLSAGPNIYSWMDQIALITTNPASHNQAAWSFTGIKVGDVNCSAAVDGFVSEDPDGLFAANSHTPIGANQIFTIQVKAAGNTPIAGWQMGIEFDKEKMQFLEVQPGTTSSTFSMDNFGVSEVAQGKIRALGLTESGVGQSLNNLTLFKVKMKALQPIANVNQYFRLESSVLPEEFITAAGSKTETIGSRLDVQSGGMGLAGNPGMNQQIDSKDPNWISTYPVPFSSEIVFDFMLPVEESVHLSLFDSFGRLVGEQSESLSEGFHSIKMNGLSNWPTGVYWYRFESGGHSNFGKILKD